MGSGGADSILNGQSLTVTRFPIAVGVSGIRSCEMNSDADFDEHAEQLESL
jgi:hypothetical protein